MQAHAQVVESRFAKPDKQYAQLVGYLNSEESHAMTHSELEREVEARIRELARSLLQAHLDTRSPGEASGPVRDSQGRERTEKREHSRTLATVFGAVEVHRVGYGAEGLDSLHPLDAELNLPPERYSHELRRRAAEETAKASFDEAVASIGRNTGTRSPNDSLKSWWLGRPRTSMPSTPSARSALPLAAARDR